jgi:hypothetical protein
MTDVETSGVGAKKPPDNVLADWWIWMKFYMELMALKVASITPKWLSFPQ